MKIGIVGLGLIGGSLAKAYKAAGHRVLAHNRSRSTLDFAMLSGAVDEELTKENIGDCDLVLVAVYPQAAIDYLKEMGYNLWDPKGDEVQTFIENQMDSMERYVELLESK